jgi:phytoene dehydrogenase-like protein
VILRRSLNETAAGLGADGKAWRELVEPFLEDYEALMEDAMGRPGIPSNPIMMTRFATRALRSAEGLARSRFKGHRAQALFAGCAAHSILPLDMTVSAAVAVMFAIVAHVENWPVARGGSSQISNALASLFRSLGGEIQTGRRVNSLKELPQTKVVLFNTDPRQLESICGDELPISYRKRLKKFRYGPAGFKLDWALDGPIPWSDPQTRLATTVHVGGRMEDTCCSVSKAKWTRVALLKASIPAMHIATFPMVRLWT